MQRSEEKIRDRRRFLSFLAASPLLMGGGVVHGPLAKLFAMEPGEEKRAHDALDRIAQGEDLITSPEQALGFDGLFADRFVEREAEFIHAAFFDQ